MKKKKKKHHAAAPLGLGGNIMGNLLASAKKAHSASKKMKNKKKKAAKAPKKKKHDDDDDHDDVEDLLEQAASTSKPKSGGVLDRLMGGGDAASTPVLPVHKKHKSVAPHHADMASTMSLLKNVVHKANAAKAKAGKSVMDRLMGGGGAVDLPHVSHKKKAVKKSKKKAKKVRRSHKKSDSWKDSFNHHGKNPFDDDDSKKDDKDDEPDVDDSDMFIHTNDLSFSDKPKKEDNPFVMDNPKERKKKDHAAVDHLINIGASSDDDEEGPRSRGSPHQHWR